MYLTNTSFIDTINIFSGIEQDTIIQIINDYSIGFYNYYFLLDHYKKIE